MTAPFTLTPSPADPQPVKPERVNQMLDELASLLEHWQRNRSEDYTPQAIRAAALMMICEIHSASLGAVECKP
jgi:hypothetical protein